MKNSLLSTTLLSLLFFFSSNHCFKVSAEEIPLPEATDLEKFTKDHLPPFIKFSTLQIKEPRITGKTLTYNTVLTGSLGEHLYRDVTDEIPEISNAPKTSLEPPTIIKKLHGAGEIMEFPIEILYRNIKDEWKPESMDDHQKFSELGKPQSDFKFGAVIFGSSDARRLITQYVKESQTAPKFKKKSLSESNHPSTTPKAESSSNSISTDVTSNSLAAVSIEPATSEEVRESEKEVFKELVNKIY
jgi:hypothetical protein